MSLAVERLEKLFAVDVQGVGRVCTDREVTKALMILAIALTAVAIILFIVLNLGFLRVAGKPPALSTVDLKQI